MCGANPLRAGQRRQLRSGAPGRSGRDGHGGVLLPRQTGTRSRGGHGAPTNRARGQGCPVSLFAGSAGGSRLRAVPGPCDMAAPGHVPVPPGRGGAALAERGGRHRPTAGRARPSKGGEAASSAPVLPGLLCPVGRRSLGCCSRGP